MISKENLQKIVEISSYLRPGYKFSMKCYLEGNQMNWIKGKHSIMWRDVNWIKEEVEVFDYRTKDSKMCLIRDLTKLEKE
jgi:hypothetical protein